MMVRIAKSLLIFMPQKKRYEVENVLRKIFYHLKKEPNYSFFSFHEFLLNLMFVKPDSYIVLPSIPKQINDKIIEMAKKNKISIKELQEDVNPLLIMENHEKQIIDKLNDNIIGIRGDIEVYKDLHNWLFTELRKYVKSPFAFVNTRTWISRPNSSRFGPNHSHTDGFYAGHIKVMVYSTPLNKEYGELEIENDRISNKREGATIAFRNSDVTHSGVPGLSEERISTEITCFRSLVNISQEHEGAILGRHYKSILTPYFLYVRKYGIGHFIQLILSTLLFFRNKKIWTISNVNIFKFVYSYLVHFIHKFIKADKVNIGSGRYVSLNWNSLDEIDFPGITKIKLNKKVVFPFNKNALSMAYTSHNLEHLDDDTVTRVLKETNRVLKKNGYLLIKIPDFDYFIQCYRKNDTRFLLNKGAESVAWSWKSKGVEDNIENRVAMMFCGYWNKDYGDHFSGNVTANKNSYHGPPIIEHKKLKSILLNKNIREIIKELRSIPPKMMDFKAFNHQNAWSKNDLIKLVEKEEFTFMDLNKDDILATFSKEIPTLNEYKSWSMYTVFKKN